MLPNNPILLCTLIAGVVGFIIVHLYCSKQSIRPSNQFLAPPLEWKTVINRAFVSCQQRKILLQRVNNTGNCGHIVYLRKYDLYQLSKRTIKAQINRKCTPPTNEHFQHVTPGKGQSSPRSVTRILIKLLLPVYKDSLLLLKTSRFLSILHRFVIHSDIFHFNKYKFSIFPILDSACWKEDVSPFSPITRSLDVFNNIHEASYVRNYQCVFTVFLEPLWNLACPRRAGSVLETAAAFKGDFMRRRFKILPPSAAVVTDLELLLLRTNPSRLPRTEKRLGSGHGQDFSLSNDRASIPFPFHHPLLLFLSTVFPCPIARQLSMLRSPSTTILAPCQTELKRGRILRETYSSSKFPSNPYLSLKL